MKCCCPPCAVVMHEGSSGCIFGALDGEPGLQSKNEGLDLVHLGQAPSLAALRGAFVIYDGRAG